MERMLIVKIKRTDETHADLFGKGHRYKDLTLFDLGELLAVGITPEDLPIGVEKPCRFWALYELSEKLNQAGLPYKDIVALEAFDKPATAASVDRSAELAVLRNIERLLGELVRAVGGDMPEMDEEPYLSTTPEPGPQEPPPDNGDGEPDQDLPTLEEFFGESTPTSPKELLNLLVDSGVEYKTVRELHDALAREFTDTWKGWPPKGDLAAWEQITKTALHWASA